MTWTTFKLLLALPIRVVKSKDCLHQYTMGLCITNHDNPRMIGCQGEEIRSNVMVSQWDPIMSSSGIVSSMMAPNMGSRLSITSNEIDFVFTTLGMECEWPKSTSIKHVVALESSRAVVHITQVPIYKLTDVVKPFRDGASWIELIIWLMETNFIALTARGLFRFLAHDYLSPGKRLQDVRTRHYRNTTSCLIDVIVVHWTMIGRPLYPPPSA